MTLIRAAIYGRKSREEENSTKEETLHDQMTTLNKLAALKGYKVKDEDIYKEVESSIKADRPELIKLMKAIEQGKYNRLLITHIDRLGRDIGLLDDLKKLCEAQDVIIETPDNTINFKDNNHDLMYGFSSVLADFEYKRIRHRLATGKVNTVENRGRWVGSNPPYGMVYDKNEKTLKPHLEQSKVYRKMVDYMLEGYSYSEVANTLNDLGYRTQLNNRWTAGRIQKILKNRTYLGEATYNSTRLNKQVTAKDCHEPLITEDEYNRIQQIAGSRRNYDDTRSWGKTKTVLDGLIFCGKCKRGMSIQLSKKHSKKRGEWSFYQVRRCIHKDENGVRCSNHGCKVEILEELLMSTLKSWRVELEERRKKLKNNDNSSLIRKIEEKTKDIEDSIKKNKQKISKLTDLFLDEVLTRDEHDKRRENLIKQNTDLKHELDSLANKINNLDTSKVEKEYVDIMSYLDIVLDETKPVDKRNKSLKRFLLRMEVIKDVQYQKPLLDLDFINII
jgi:site-specific DNA recombinase